MQTFGTRMLPPPSLLPDDVARAVVTLSEARQRTAKAQQELGQLRRIELPAAKQRDITAHADAVERKRAAPEPRQEREVVQRIAAAERSAGAAELLEQRAVRRLEELIDEHRERIAEDTGKRLAAARSAYGRAIDDLESATSDLVVASALSAWAADPARSYKERGLRAVPLPPTADEPTVDVVLAALREVVEPRQRPSMPSPFSAPAAVPVEPTPAPAA